MTDKTPFSEQGAGKNYDRWYEAPYGQFCDRLEKRAVRALLPQQRGTLLEIGSGTGHWSLWFSRQGFQVTGIEPAGDMLARAESKVPGARFVQARAESFELERQFDLAAFITSLAFIQERERTLKNVLAHVRPGGCVILGCLNRDSFLGGEGHGFLAGADFLGIEDVVRLFAAYGKITLDYTLYTPAGRLAWAFVAEPLGRLLHKRKGAFIAGRIDLWTSRLK